ncbi:hypothetical protein V8F33_005785 [Rhypophila sp. PSN 637]
MESTARKRKYFPCDDSSSDEEESGVGRDGRLIPQTLRPVDDLIDNANGISPTTPGDGSSLDFAGEVIIQSPETATARATAHMQTRPQYLFGTSDESRAIDSWTLALFVAGTCTHSTGPGAVGIALKFLRINPGIADTSNRQEVVKTFKLQNSSLLFDDSTQAIALLEGIEAAYSELESAIHVYGKPKAAVVPVMVFSAHSRILSLMQSGYHKRNHPQTKAQVVLRRILGDVATGSHPLIQKMEAADVKIDLQFSWCPRTQLDSHQVRLLSRDARREQPQFLI